ncbi:hypothetical protein RIR_jg8949.t1 [Rhizophagus irregularis DAOM 181602=DAOM 197198]|nr:hypothetical protein RIR_jg8949.t1 [Rhizophagus irregularis DAOM 181602=DAOM 197198]
MKDMNPLLIDDNIESECYEISYSNSGRDQEQCCSEYCPRLQAHASTYDDADVMYCFVSIVLTGNIKSSMWYRRQK